MTRPKLFTYVAERGVVGLLRFACILALVALAIMCSSILFPRPLPVILAMSGGHAVGGAAFVAYLLAVVIDSAKRGPAHPETPPTPTTEIETPNRLSKSKGT